MVDRGTMAKGLCPEGPTFPEWGLRLGGLSGTTIKTNKQKQLKPLWQTQQNTTNSAICRVLLHLEQMVVEVWRSVGGWPSLKDGSVLRKVKISHIFLKKWKKKKITAQEKTYQFTTVNTWNLQDGFVEFSHVNTLDVIRWFRNLKVSYFTHFQI